MSLICCVYYCNINHSQLTKIICKLNYVQSSNENKKVSCIHNSVNNVRKLKLFHNLKMYYSQARNKSLICTSQNSNDTYNLYT